MLCCSLSFLYMILGPDAQPSYWQLEANTWRLHGQVEPGLGRQLALNHYPLGYHRMNVPGVGLGPDLVSFLQLSVLR